jgi:hypothetical protein
MGVGSGWLPIVFCLGLMAVVLLVRCWWDAGNGPAADRNLGRRL